MIVLKLVQMLLTVLLFSSECRSHNTLPRKCELIQCKKYPGSAICPKGYSGDPITKECRPKCEKSCENGYCLYCYCYVYDNSEIINYYNTFSSKCERILKAIRCNSNECDIAPLEICNNLYVINPYDRYECIPRCTADFCGNGWCTQYGHCICKMGYRPDPLNPTICTEIPSYNMGMCKNDTQQITTPKPNKNPPICKNSTINDTTNNNSTHSCKCPDSHGTNETTSTTTESQLNQTDNEKFCEERIASNISDLYVPISVALIAIFFIAICILTFIIIRMKNSVAITKEEAQTDAGNNYYSTVRYQKKSNDVLVENVELYGETQ